MRRTAQTLVLVAVLCLAVGPDLLAQESPDRERPGLTLETLQISLWPEFDRPAMLVIYRGILAADTPLPVTLEIRIPADVGDPFALAYVDEAGQRLTLPYTSRVEGQERVVSFGLPALPFQLEYYDELPVDDSGQRRYTFDFQADYAVRKLSVEFLVPPTATDASLQPPADSVVPEANSLVYHLVEAGALSQGETRGWTFVYDKENADLIDATAGQQDAAAALPTITAPVEGDTPTGLLFLVGFVALVAVGGAAFWLGRRTATESPPVVAAPYPARKERATRGIGQAAFCHKCGTQLRPDSEFCHKCGASVREE